jgi:pyruvyl transferase EpsO
MNKFEPYKPIKDLIINDYVLLDLPYHINIGDLLIWQGELAFLMHEVKHKMLGYYNQSTFGFPKLKKDTVILLHGGGNFGDVWRGSQVFRLEVIKRYPDNRIVIFPQSVYYSTDELAMSDAEQFAKHQDLTICARDKVSFEYINRFFTNNLLCIPDMAFCIDMNLFKPNILEQTKDNLFFKRTDHEFRQVTVDFIEGEYDTCDWPGTEKLSVFIKCLYILMIYTRRIRKLGVLGKVVAFLLSWCVNKIFMYIVRPQYIKRGVRFISQYRNIYTTRLHGLILSYLLDKKIFIVSNNNGKLENYYNSWLTDCKNIKIISC